MFLGIDVGGTKVAAALVRAGGRLAGKMRRPVDQSSSRSAVEQLESIIDTFTSAQLRGIGVAVPGIADQKTQTVWAPNIRGWEHIRLQEQLQKRARVPVSVESDRNTAVLGEVLFGAAKGKEDVIFLILGTGIGAGILAGGELVRGAHDIGGAVGWMPVCFQGKIQHFESVAAGPGIEKLAEKMLGVPCRLPYLAAQARRGDDQARGIFREVGTVIGQALSALVSTFNPELIVLGGGVSQSWDLMKASAGRALRQWSQPIARNQVRVVVSRLGEEAGILGAAAAARHRLEDGLNQILPGGRRKEPK